MNALFLAVIGVAMMLGGYFLYSRYLGSRIYKLNASFRTPAHALEDGVDYVPTNKYVLWGHHFTSVAGAAPIVGPAIAVIWGWVPAFLWVTIGTVFIAGMHDFGALWASGRHRGQSIGTLSGRYIGRNGRNLFLMIIFLLLLMVNAAFAVVIAKLLVSTPTSVIPTWGAIIVALLIGQAIYRLKWNLPPVSLVGVIALYALMVIGNSIPVVLPETILGLNPNGFWIVVLFLYAGVASLLPVWVLLQPRDYINGLQLFVGLIILYGSIALSLPTVVAPTFNTQLPEGTPSMIPLLFVTIACGAISGFHGLVSSGTSSKQIDLETDERFVGYFGAVGEGLLALGAIIATCAGYQTVTQWREVYSAFGKGSVGAFVEGGSGIIHAGLGLPSSLSATILATMAVLFAATTMDTGVRLQRLVVQEIGDHLGVKLSNIVATVIVLVVALGLTFSSGGDGSGGLAIWPLFGTTNQLMATLTLCILCIILIRLRRPYKVVLVPMVFVMAVSVWALVIQLGTFYTAGNWMLLILDLIILVAAVWVVAESVRAMRDAMNSPAITDAEFDEATEVTDDSDTPARVQ
ncbi:carbon starvation protein A [Corynebacterium sp. CCM 8835]|uniref:Carbon starvation protein A n=1 Tax=Corynebacterium antarcticum TaxID=2800405 RepID=A0ABS1FLN1_9CORY|nr:carbon starvation protein A [Corynebacterium antarcticum]MCK7642698.1 carbon starvation protein A [Corynebacterium antarcticum]MCL0245360.1 carbon starvation protein A [Corynebacterium antarcticum]MCX7539930.1 carbon starvation protein A [Corynebacterium antarcticum]